MRIGKSFIDIHPYYIHTCSAQYSQRVRAGMPITIPFASHIQSHCWMDCREERRAGRGAAPVVANFQDVRAQRYPAVIISASMSLFASPVNRKVVLP